MSGDQSAQQPGGGPKKKPRNPVERAVVWGLIAVMGGLVGWEAVTLVSYNTTLNRLTGQLTEADEKGGLKLADANKLIVGFPRRKDEKRGMGRRIELIWPSLFKTYAMTMVIGIDDIVIDYKTPGVVVEEPRFAPEGTTTEPATPARESPTSTEAPAAPESPAAGTPATSGEA